MHLCTAANEGNAYKYGVSGRKGEIPAIPRAQKAIAKSTEGSSPMEENALVWPVCLVC